MIAALSPTTERDALYTRFESRIKVNPDLDRRLVSYQADKETPFYGWFKYREGFTSQLVGYLLRKVHPEPGVLLDPFAGSGTALFAASSLDWQTCGIDVLPVSIYAIEARVAAEQVDPDLFAAEVRRINALRFGEYYAEKYKIEHIAITKGAFPPQGEKELIGYISYCHKHITNEEVRKLALYAGFCILEDISYTRKDGQYLRWDARSGRSQGKEPFAKGPVIPFSTAINNKLDQILYDTSGMPKQSTSGQLSFDFRDDAGTRKTMGHTPQAISGSCLTILPTLPSETVDVILTSPPYCNRYDYTRTYALELVYLGANHEEVSKLRQEMLSCTVENKTKQAYLNKAYQELGREAQFTAIDDTFNKQAALQEVLHNLEVHRVAGELNNSHIVRLVRNYFYEMCFIIFEMARVLSPGGNVIMVNDNVRYAGEEVPVDIILSSIAEAFGLETEKIWTLTRGKGNSSQQMGMHGRSELRKCVYVWRKPGYAHRARTEA